MDQDTRPRDPRRSTNDSANAESSQSTPLRIRQRDLLKNRSPRASANSYLDKLLQTVTTTVSGYGQTAPIVTSGALYDRCVSLVQSLGDPDSSGHIHAPEELVSLGTTALPALFDGLHPDGPWLIAYRAAEILGEIGDRRAAQPLINALSHPNSNVRWSVVRSLSVVGNTRALFALRKIARDDRSKTTWGESIAGVAQSAIDQMQGSNLFVKATDILKTAVSTVVLLLALVLAWNVLERVRSQVSTIGVKPTITATVPADAALNPGPQTTPTVDSLVPTQAVAQTISGVIVNPGNVRSQPAIQTNNVVGQVVENDEIIYLATTPDRTWFKIKLGAKRAATSSISSTDGAGWINQSLVSAPETALPIEDIQLPTRIPAMTTTAIPTPSSTIAAESQTAPAAETATVAGAPKATATIDPLLPVTPTP
ncbi:MAG: HEAT repeat domain-containing protein [Chloroflexales bacterium]|nr:HEAT repeat domain-containing protein [Chloroflexales bacterium]